MQFCTLAFSQTQLCPEDVRSGTAELRLSTLCSNAFNKFTLSFNYGSSSEQVTKMQYIKKMYVYSCHRDIFREQHCTTEKGGDGGSKGETK